MLVILLDINRSQRFPDVYAGILTKFADFFNKSREGFYHDVIKTH
ncbi:Uncharacterised protein [Serratia entomophila]|jgi:hypothetical protein|nr:Uncharacterised protein [Serratia entomophila]CAI0702541.1 Uncharacterised protein [Serratia entomophila]CAI0731425.1 Uncharacterised protein [Serratia entomophila]CAI0792047.1 Uncharacterised protein [Serratia entomophila]CAI0816483.1 Uncharacterised protein [Serratia entomophila]